MRFRGKHVVVTGGSSGIGAAVAQGFAAEGAHVLALGRRFVAGEAAFGAAGEVVNRRLDVADVAAVDAALPPLADTIDVLVCAAGHGLWTSVLETPVDALRGLLDAHVVGTFACIKAVLPAMRARGAGHIMIVSSVAAKTTFPDCSAYTAAKAAQLGLAKVLAAEVRRFGIAVTAILPGATDTPIWDDRPEFDRRKMLRPADVAGVMLDVAARPAVALDEVVIMPPGGAL